MVSILIGSEVCGGMRPKLEAEPGTVGGLSPSPRILLEPQHKGTPGPGTAQLIVLHRTRKEPDANGAEGECVWLGCPSLGLPCLPGFLITRRTVAVKTYLTKNTSPCVRRNPKPGRIF